MTVYLPLIAKKYPPFPSTFGVQMWKIDNTGGLQQAQEAGVRWVRFSAFAWDQIEPVRTDPPTYNWNQVDETSLINAHANGFQVIATVQFTPQWAQKYNGSYCGPIREDALDEFAQFLSALVERYKNPPYNIKYWELGNEPDAPVWYDRSGFGCWGEESDTYYGGGYYAQMLKSAYPAIKAADPQAQVLLGGLLLDHSPSFKDDNVPRFLEGILREGGGPYFDIVSFHAYTYYRGNIGRMGNLNWSSLGTAIPEKVDFVRSVLRNYGFENKPLINTESALLCSEPINECLETQAMYIPRAYAEALALRLPGQIYFAMINEGWRYTGLVYPDLTPKPAYRAYRTAAEWMGDVRYVAPVTTYEGITGYLFARFETNAQIQVLWSTDGNPRNITLPAGAVAYNRYGEFWGTGTVSVDFSPIYVRLP